ncbi:RING-H2 finger protein ATL22-like [Salvia miltiorrhiza]|uniref:RING-H2 finger protein ATL22-like n=1 Tax=Salvia miltiorrhiza TaxID=226208 RepID=UPI0025ACA2CB|nr:RING-H2 finger protein ATL22-like [Salvia miltiorrhiza]
MGLCIIIYLLLLALFNISTILAQDLCPSFHCGNVTVHYPFKLEDETPPTWSSCTYINLNCNRASNATILNLPHLGEFYVHRIDYTQLYIQLYDPRNCLTERLFDSSLSPPISSPFKAAYDNYTLYVCPLDFPVDPILCLSNSTNVTVAARGSFKDEHRCQATRTGPLPVYHDANFLFLTWDYDDCIKCKDSDDHDSGRKGSKIISKIVAVALTLPGLIIMSLTCCYVFCFHLMRMIGGRYVPDFAAVAAESGAAPLPSITSNPAGLDESKIVRCTELVIVNGDLSCKSTKTCSICLENYSEKETVSVISKCQHCFHTHCIQQWLEKSDTCPVCRTSLSDVV